MAETTCITSCKTGDWRLLALLVLVLCGVRRLVLASARGNEVRPKSLLAGVCLQSAVGS